MQDIDRKRALWAKAHDWFKGAEVVNADCVVYRVTVVEQSIKMVNGTATLKSRSLSFTSWAELRAWAGY